MAGDSNDSVSTRSPAVTVRAPGAAARDDGITGALELHKLGTSIELAAWSAQLMRTRMRELFEEFAIRWTSEAGHLYAGEGTQAKFEANLEAIRSVVWQSAAHVAAEEIERVIHRIDEIRAR